VSKDNNLGVLLVEYGILLSEVKIEKKEKVKVMKRNEK